MIHNKVAIFQVKVLLTDLQVSADMFADMNYTCFPVFFLKNVYIIIITLSSESFAKFQDGVSLDQFTGLI